ncbi:MAG TPA: roadblock/LC7 domain-containing protein [Steroidobacter sp.]|jgi:predicted regulator of Ras-like GTPase activity (Roadblock/LC7/MglB family)|nr:roadblock/LC7 domain-containing protein [Steroidobacter sp.]
MNSLDAKGFRERYGAAMLQELKALTSKNPGLLAAQVCTVDGFEVVAAHRSEESRRRLAAMASSIHALGCAIVQEVSLGSYQNLVLEGSNGTVLMMAVPNCNGALLLTAVASNEALFGRFHYVCKNCCETIGKQLLAKGASA